MRLPLALAFGLFLFALAHAEMNVTLPQSACAQNGDILAVLNNLPACTAESFFTSLASGMVYTSQQFLHYAIDFVSATPDLAWFCAPYNQLMALLESLYSIALMGVGFYYIVQASEVEGRIKAKAWLKDVFFMIVVLTFSFNIFDALVSLNHYFTSSLLNEQVLGMFNANISFASIIFALVVLGGILLTAGITFLTLLMRYMLVPFLLMLFPVSIFLYFMPFGRRWGGAFLRAIVIILFMTAIDALFLFALSALFNADDQNLAAPFVRSFALMVGFGTVGMLNMALFLMALLALAEPALGAVGPLKWLALPVVYSLL